MTKVQIYSAKGTKTGTMDFPKEFMSEPNISLLAQAMHVYEDRSHKKTSKVKTRSEVNASGAKIYKQKGTGRARHGDIKAPIFAGGGIAHGPKAVKRTLKLSKNIRESALRTILGSLTKEGKVAIVDKLESINKTKDAKNLLDSLHDSLEIKKPVGVILAVSNAKKEIARFFRNLESVDVTSWHNINPYLLFNTQLLIVDKEALSERPNQKKSEEKTPEVKPAAKTLKSQKAIKAKKPAKKATQKTATKKAVSKKKTKI